MECISYLPTQCCGPDRQLVSNVSESTVRSPLDEVIARLRKEVDAAEDPLSAIIYGVDEGWEVSLLKFATDMIQESSGENLGDFRRRGLL